MFEVGGAGGNAFQMRLPKWSTRPSDQWRSAMGPLQGPSMTTCRKAHSGGVGQEQEHEQEHKHLPRYLLVARLAPAGSCKDHRRGPSEAGNRRHVWKLLLGSRQDRQVLFQS